MSILDEQGAGSSLELASKRERAGASTPALARPRARDFHLLYWAAIPLLAIAAYILVGQIGFLGDDLWLLYEARRTGPTLQVFVPDPGWYFYRPIVMLFTWQLGWQMWGFNPVPYHLLSVLAHSLVSLVLGLWLAELTGKRAPAWLTAALFAVFPLHVEAIGWLASQWDLWAALFGLLSIWCFTKWWRKGESKTLYWLSVFFYAAGIFTKESLFTFIPAFAVAAWVADERNFSDGPRRLNWRRLALSLVAFVGVLGFNLVLRLVFLGEIGGYPGRRFNYQDFIWDTLMNSVRPLVSPVNPTVLGVATSQVVGVLVTLALLAGLTLFGRANIRLLGMASMWILLTLLPVLNFGVRTNTLESSRYLYLPSIGYSIVVGTLLYSATRAVVPISRRSRQLVRLAWAAGLALLLVMGIASSWVQIGPWRSVSVQSQVLNEELLHLIPPQQRPTPMWWYVNNQPRFVYGVDVFSLGFGFNRFFEGKGDVPTTETVESTSDLPVVEQASDAFVVRFRRDADENLFHVDYASGVTADGPPPAGDQAGEDARVWDFAQCAPDVLKQWSVVQAETECAPGKGLLFRPLSPDAQMVNSELAYDTAGAKARFVRVRVAVQYDPIENSGGQTPAEARSQWYWTDNQGGWSEERSRTLRLKKDGNAHIYWSFLPAADTGGALHALRFDPSTLELNSQVRWIAIDQVK